MTERQKRSFVLGLDGVPWDLVDEWTARGELPNFGRIVEEGVSGPLRSTKPANTPVAWPSIATGTWQDGHGIYEFMKLLPEHTQRPYDRRDLRRPPLWEFLSPAAVANLPMTYPAEISDGTMVSGMMSPALDERAVAPVAFLEEIRDRIPGYEIGLDWKTYDDDETFRSDLHGLVDARRELMRALLGRDEWELVFFVYTAPDRLQHFVWDRDTLLAEYRRFDDVLGEVLEYCEANGYSLYVVSDHGFGPVRRSVNVNSVLRDEGFLVEKRPSLLGRTLSGIGATKSNVLTSLERIGIDDETIVSALPASVVDAAATRIPGSHELYDVEFDETVAFLHGLGSVYVNDTERFDEGVVEPDRIPEVKRGVATALGDLRDPETGERPLVVHDGDEVCPSESRAPDLVVEGADEYSVDSPLAEACFSDPGDRAADHRSEGVFLAWGDDIRGGGSVDDATVVDVLPTVLHGAGRPIPDHVDGRVLGGVFDPESAPRREPPRHERYGEYTSESTEKRPDEDFENVEERLRGLGYME